MANNKNQKITVEFKAQTSEFQQNIKDITAETTTLKKELRLNAEQLKGNAENVDLLSERQELLEQQAQLTENKMNALTSELEIAENLYGANSKEVRNLTNKIVDCQTEHQKIQNEIKGVETKINDLTNAYDENENQLDDLIDNLDDTSDELENTGDSIDDFGDGFTVAKGVVTDFVSNALSSCIESLKDLAIQTDTAFGKLQAQTGATAEEMEDFKESINNIYATGLGEDINDIASAFAEVKQQLKTTDSSVLEDVTKKALVLKDTFDFDVKESVRAVNSMMNQFGVSSEEAFNLLVQGSQNGLNANGDLLDVINEYSVQFSGIGYSAEEMFNMLCNGATEGTWSVDKLGDAVKEFNIRMSDGTAKDYVEQLGMNWDEVNQKFQNGGEDSKQVFQEIMEKISELDGTTEGYTIGVGILGTMYEDLGQDTIKALSKIDGAFDKNANSMDEVSEIMQGNVTTSLEQLSRKFQEDFLIPIVEELLPLLNEALNFLCDNLNWLVPVVTGLGVAFTTYFAVSKISSLITTFVSLFSAVQSGTGIMGALNVVMSANPIGAVATAIGLLITAFMLLWNNCDGFREFWINLWAKIKEVMAPVIEWAKEFFGNMIESAIERIETFKKVFTTIFNVIKTVATSIFEDIKLAITNPIEFAKKRISQTVEAIKKVFKFTVSLPNIKLPHFSIQPKGWQIGDLLKGKIPKLGIDWHADGGIFAKPTLIQSANGVHGVGEAGAEAILPLNLLENWINNGFIAVASTNISTNEKISELVGLTEKILDKDVNTYLDGVKVSNGLAPTLDKSNSSLFELKSRGLAL